MKLAKSNWSSYVNYTMDGLNQFTDGYALIIGVGADLPVTVVDAGAINDILTKQIAKYGSLIFFYLI